MSLRYKLFDTPKTIEEFIDKVKRNKNKQINVHWSSKQARGFSDGVYGGGTLGRKDSLEINSKNAKLENIATCTYYQSVRCPTHTLEIRKYQLETAIKIAEYLKQNNLKVTIEEKPLSYSTNKLKNIQKQLNQ